MEHALAVVDDTPASKALVREAGSYASAEGAALSLYVMISSEELGRTVSTLDTIGEVENTSYGTDTALDGARAFVDDVAKDALADVDIEYDCLCKVVDKSDRADATIEAANENGCDHIFTAGRNRSPTGKALFGDYVQSIILSFDGRVTVDLQ